MPKRAISTAETQGLELLAAAVEHVPDIVEITDANWVVQYVNPAFERLTGYSAEDALGTRTAQLLGSPAHDDGFYDRVYSALAAGETWEGRISSRTKRGDPLILEMVISPIRSEAGAITNYVAVKRDVTDRENLRTRLMQSERLAAVGQLAAGVSHEINNPLAYVLANINFLAEEIPGALRPDLEDVDRNDFESAIADIEQGAARIRDVVKDLSSFSRFNDEQPEPIDPRKVIDSTLKLLVNELKHRATLVRLFGDVPKIEASTARLSQVFFNLVVNALQSIPVGQAAEQQIRVRTSTDASGNAVIEVSDTGEGIPEAVLPKIFNPFFTTRTGKGTGLGLSICHSIVTGLGGTLSVHSRPAEGTTVTVVLPPCEDACERSGWGPRVGPAAGRKPHILVVDDEAGVLRAIRRILHGFTLTTYTSGEEALERLQTDEFDLILCDLMMPNITGIQVYRHAVAKAPKLAGRFVFMTGGVFTSDARQFLTEVPNPSIEKPFLPEQLRAQVKQALGVMSGAASAS